MRVNKPIYITLKYYTHRQGVRKDWSVNCKQSCGGTTIYRMFVPVGVQANLFRVRQAQGTLLAAHRVFRLPFFEERARIESSEVLDIGSSEQPTKHYCRITNKCVVGCLLFSRLGRSCCGPDHVTKVRVGFGDEKQKMVPIIVLDKCPSLIPLTGLPANSTRSLTRKNNTKLRYR